MMAAGDLIDFDMFKCGWSWVSFTFSPCSQHTIRKELFIMFPSSYDYVISLLSCDDRKCAKYPTHKRLILWISQNIFVVCVEFWCVGNLESVIFNGKSLFITFNEWKMSFLAWYLIFFPLRSLYQHINDDELEEFFQGTPKMCSIHAIPWRLLSTWVNIITTKRGHGLKQKI